MATLVLGAVGTAIGGAVGGSILGMTAATIGGMIGSTIGSVVDMWIVSALQPGQRYEGQRLDAARITSSTEGATIPRVFGSVRLGGNIIWATDFREESKTTSQGGKGGGPEVSSTEYSYYASFAVAICDGPISGIGRVWADGELLDMSDINWRWYAGGEGQGADPTIKAAMGGAATPAYRGTAYAVFEDLLLTDFGNRLPQLTFEVFRSISDPNSVEGMMEAVVLIPGTGEFAYATELVRRGEYVWRWYATTEGESMITGGWFLEGEEAINSNAVAERPDLMVALDRLEQLAPNVKSVTLVVSWFGNDLRAGHCKVRPGVEQSARDTTPLVWEVCGTNRANAYLVSRDEQDRPVFGGTPSDETIIQTIRELKSRGYRVTFYPFILMDIPAGNTLPNPYSDNASVDGQDVFPWRGRITCSPAAGLAGTVDKTAAAGTQVDNFFGNANRSHFTPDQIDERVVWSGPSDEWGYRRMVLHYAYLCWIAADVDAFILASELRGITRIRSDSNTYPAVTKLKNLAADVKTILGAVKPTGSAPLVGEPSLSGGIYSILNHHFPSQGRAKRRDWDTTTYEGSLLGWNVKFPSPVGTLERGQISIVRDWTREECGLLPGETATVRVVARQRCSYPNPNPTWHSSSMRTRLFTFESKFGSEPDYSNYRRHSQVNGWAVSYSTNGWAEVQHDHSWTMTAASEFFRLEMQLESDQTGVVEVVEIVSSSGNRKYLITPRAGDVSYAADWSEYFGHHPQDGTGDVFFNLDPLWSDENIDFVGIDNYMPLSDWRDGNEHLDAQAGASGVYDLDYLRSNIAGGEGFDWFYASDLDRAQQVRTPITDGAYGKPWVFRYKDLISWWENTHRNRPGGVEGATTAWASKMKPFWFTEFGCPAIDRGANQPNVFVDPKSSESNVPYFSRGWRDDTMQRAYLEAHLGYWANNANNPGGSFIRNKYVRYSGRMVKVPEMAAWTWDARPHPWFPALSDVWTDGGNWRLGHWLNGRIGAVSLRALVRRLCLDAGLHESRFDVSDLHGAVDGFVISGIESPKTTISMLARHFGFDACESEGVIKFVSRGRAPALTFTPDDMVRQDGGEVMEIVRGQETELPQALKWQVTRNDEEFDAVVVEARRTTVDSARISAETFPIVVPPEEADRRVRRALQETWTGRERATFALPPSRIALDPTDVVVIDHDGRDYEFRLMQIGDAEVRNLEGIRQDREVYDLPPGASRSGGLRQLVVRSAPTVAFLDIPILFSDQRPHRPLLAAARRRGTGRVAVYRSSSATEGYELVTTFNPRSRIGALAAVLPRGPVHVFDNASELVVNMPGAGLVSISDDALFAGRNSFAVETQPGVWEVLQAGSVEIVSAGRYRLTHLLRGQRGTEWAMRDSVEVGAAVVVLDSTLIELPISEADVGVPWYWRIGPAKRAVSDVSYRQVQFTPMARGVEPFSGVHVEQPFRHGRTLGDLTISWIRRSRALAADIWSTGEIPLGEESQEYEVDIRQGSTVKRTLASDTPSVVYTAAQQTADFGSTFGPGDTLAITIYQVTASAGRGFPYKATLKF